MTLAQCEISYRRNVLYEVVDPASSDYPSCSKEEIVFSDGLQADGKCMARFREIEQRAVIFTTN